MNTTTGTDAPARYSREYHVAILGEAVVAAIEAQVAANPEPPPELIDKLRPILAVPAQRIRKSA